jgi:hypothetical protein
MVLIETAIKMLSNLNTNIKEHWDLHLFNYFLAMFHYKSHEVAFKLSGSPSVPANILSYPERMKRFCTNLVHDIFRFAHPQTHVMPRLRNTQAQYAFVGSFLVSTRQNHTVT